MGGSQRVSAWTAARGSCARTGRPSTNRGVAGVGCTPANVVSAAGAAPFGDAPEQPTASDSRSGEEIQRVVCFMVTAPNDQQIPSFAYRSGRWLVRSLQGTLAYREE